MRRGRSGLFLAFILLLFCAPAAPQQPNQRRWKGQTHLVFSGGIGNFPRVGAWLISGLFGQFRPGKFTGEVLITGNGYGVEMRNIQEGYAQLGVTIPAATPYMASKGIGLFANTKPNPNLRGFFKLPRRTCVTFAIRQDLGVPLHPGGRTIF